jgi:hypothetical protein
MPVFENWLKDPLSIINNIFNSDPINFNDRVNEYFEAKFSSEKNYQSIPCLNEVPLHDLTSNCLVRYRCMIQDSFDPVYYTAIQKLKNKETNSIKYINHKYKETIEDYPEDYEACSELTKDDFIAMQMNEQGEGDDHSETKDITSYLKNNLQQRLTFYCVPIPGESEWVKKVYLINTKSFTNQNYYLIFQ